MRAYQPLWEALKSKGEVSLTTDKKLHERVHKAIRKEALMDTMFNQSVLHRDGKYYISKTWAGDLVTFKIVWTKELK